MIPKICHVRMHYTMKWPQSSFKVFLSIITRWCGISVTVSPFKFVTVSQGQNDVVVISFKM